MSKRKKIAPGYTRQGVKSLDYLKGVSVGRKIDMPGLSCEHPPHMVKEIDNVNGISQCKCGCRFSFDGRSI
jgi:hypothetical protein